MPLGIIGLGLAALGATIGNGLVVSNIMSAIARQPELENKLRTYMFLGIAFIEGLFFIVLAMTFVLK